MTALHTHRVDVVLAVHVAPVEVLGQLGHVGLGHLLQDHTPSAHGGHQGRTCEARLQEDCRLLGSARVGTVVVESLYGRAIFSGSDYDRNGFENMQATSAVSPTACSAFFA